MIPGKLASGWDYANTGTPGLIGPGTNATQYVPLPFLWDGGTLHTLNVTFVVFDAHAGGIGSMVMPKFWVYRTWLGTNANTNTPSSLYSAGGFSVPNPGSGSAWQNGQLSQVFALGPFDQNNVVDTQNYAYFLAIQDENGTGAAANNLYYGIEPVYTAIPNMQWG